MDKCISILTKARNCGGMTSLTPLNRTDLNIRQYNSMRRNVFQEREERSNTKYSGIFRPSHELARQNELAMTFEQQANNNNGSKRYSFLVKTANSPGRRPLTSKNSFINAAQPDQQKQPIPRKYTTDDRNDENIEKKYMSMTPNNARKPQQMPSSKKHSFVTASKANYEEPSRYNHHKTNSIKASGRVESRKLEVVSGHKYVNRTPNSMQVRKNDDSFVGQAVPEFQLPETAKRPQERYFEYIMRYSYRSKKGFIPNVQKFNQDAYIVMPNIGKKSWQHYFGICDGHGSNGHHVSGFIKNSLTNYIQNCPNFQKSPSDNLFKAYKTTVDKLLNESKIDLSYSGSTVVGCYLYHDKFYCANVGDSRAIIGRKDAKSGSWSVQAMSNDHKPDVPSEAERITRNKGRVDSFKDAEGKPVGPLRVWLRDSNGPGLAMTRSFGDLVAASVGVCWQPEIIEHTMSQNDRIILIASDGVWQFLENEDIISKLVPFYESNKIEQACDYLLQYANSSWSKESTITDDISFVLIFMNYTS